MRSLIGLAALAAIPVGIFVELAVLPVTWAVCMTLIMLPTTTSGLLWRLDPYGSISSILGVSGTVLLLLGWTTHLVSEPELRNALLVIGGGLIVGWIAFQFVRPILERRRSP